MGQTQSEARLPFSSRGEVCKELVNSEEKYVVILKKMHSYFQIPIQKSKSLVSDKKKAELIFANTEKLLEIHGHFLGALQEEADKDDDEGGKEKKKKKQKKNKKKGGSGEEVNDELEKLASRRFGAVIMEHCQDFEQEYYSYVTNYSRALQELIKCESKSKFRKFARKAAKKAGCPLTSFLVLPVLRIGEYAYLLESLAALTKEKHPDYEDCKDAQELMSQVAENINDKRRKAENFNNIFQIQYSFIDRLNLIVDHRILIKEGDVTWLHKKAFGGTTDEQIHYFLFNDVVLFAKRVASVKQVLRRFSFQKNHYKLLKYFPVSKTRLVALPGTSTTHNQLELTCGTDTYVLQAQSKEEQRNYVDIWYKASVEADLFKDIWPKSSLNIMKKKSKKERKAEKEEAKKQGVAPPEDEATATADSEYEETEYEESEMDGGDEDDEEFDELWDGDVFIEEDGRKAKTPKEKVIAHIEKAISAAEFGPRRPSLADGKKVSPLGRSTNPTHFSKKKPSGLATSANGKSPRGKKDLSSGDDDETESEEDEPGSSKKKKGSRKYDSEEEEDEEEEEEEEEEGLKKSGKGLAGSRAIAKHRAHRGSDDDDDIPSFRGPEEGCTACILF